MREPLHKYGLPVYDEKLLLAFLYYFYKDPTKSAATLEGKTITIKSKAGSGSEGKLYGKITTKEISAAIKEQLGHDVDKRKVHLEDDIRVLGDHSVSFKLHPEVTVTVTVKVEPLV